MVPRLSPLSSGLSRRCLVMCHRVKYIICVLATSRRCNWDIGYRNFLCSYYVLANIWTCWQMRLRIGRFLMAVSKAAVSFLGIRTDSWWWTQPASGNRSEIAVNGSWWTCWTLQFSGWSPLVHIIQFASPTACVAPTLTRKISKFLSSSHLTSLTSPGWYPSWHTCRSLEGGLNTCHSCHLSMSQWQSKYRAVLAANVLLNEFVQRSPQVLRVVKGSEERRHVN